MPQYSQRGSCSADRDNFLQPTIHQSLPIPARGNHEHSHFLRTHNHDTNTALCRFRTGIALSNAGPSYHIFHRTKKARPNHCFPFISFLLLCYSGGGPRVLFLASQFTISDTLTLFCLCRPNRRFQVLSPFKHTACWSHSLNHRYINSILYSKTVVSRQYWSQQ
jgi:hypothetical protein